MVKTSCLQRISHVVHLAFQNAQNALGQRLQVVWYAIEGNVLGDLFRHYAVPKLQWHHYCGLLPAEYCLS